MTRRLLSMLLLCAASLLAWRGCAAHENLPASFTLQQASQHHWDVQWRLPAMQGRPPNITPRLPSGCSGAAPQPAPAALPGAVQQRWQLACTRDLAQGVALGFDGLPASSVSVVVQLQALDGRHWSALATPRNPDVLLAQPDGSALEVGSYFSLGVVHILGGIDHLLFVLCLVWLVRARMALFKSITAFTLAHSITLALAATGRLALPAAPVEACIALSICMLAREMLAPAGAMRRPWRMAFACGLLHGMGFAGALAEVGLPKEQVTAALVLFNLGVEAGQLAFVVLLLVLGFGLARWKGAILPAIQRPAAVLIGALGMCWTLQRMAPII